MKYITYFFRVCALTLFAVTSVKATDSRNLWKDISESEITATGERYTIPSKFRALRLDLNQMSQYLATAPKEPAQTAMLKNGLLFEMPMPDGSFKRFQIFEYAMMHPDLAAKFPSIKTYTGQGIDDASATIKLDVTQLGFHAMTLSPQGSVFIDTYNKNTTTEYICYNKNDLMRVNSFTCEFDDLNTGLVKAPVATGAQRSSGTQLRTYRLALACTGEYAAYYGGTVAGAAAGMATTVNRVNGVYEKECSIRLVLIANNNSLIYTNSSTDPYTNSNGSTMLGQNQTNIDNVIGSANYDIGHVVSTGGGGVAYLACICNSSTKARGVTGSSAPTGDAFDIDYVAHEMGHQFGGNHTFNSTTGSCSGNRASSAAYEPGSGITIMAYAGICGSDDLAPHSIANFHTKSYDEINIYTTTGTGNNCPVNTATGNNPPVVTSMGSTHSIPISTPFVLTGAATDADNDTVYYSWEEYDLGPAGAWNVQSTTAPQFRPFEPTVSPSRTFPQMSDVVNNTTTVGELLPNQARTLKFRLTVRDNRAGGGGVMHPDTTLNISVVNSGGAFAVTAPNTAVTWTGGSTQTVTWNVSGTTGSGINTANVKISLSTDGGYTYPTVLLASTPNDGSQTVTVPNIATTTARIKVEAVGNIFFDISNVNFTITQSVGLTTITTSAVSPLTYCAGASVNVSFTTDAAANSGNIFTAQLSNASGSFSNPTNIGTLNSTAAGTIACVIPAGTSAGNGYRIRVVSSNPAVTGSDNGSNITISTNPSPSISGTLSFCQGSSTTLNAGSGYSSYLWSTGATTQTINVSTAGTFTVTVTNAGGCSGSTSATTNVLSNPSPSISGTLSFCQGSSTTLNAGSGYSSYLWSTGATTQTINVSTAGTFAVTVTNAGGCSGSTSATTNVLSNPSPSISGTLSFCQGSSTTLNAGSGYSSYLWSTGATTQTINVSTAGTFAVTVTNAGGCSGSTSATTNVLSNPSPSISGTLSFCQGSSTTLDAGSGYSSYLWSTGATTQTINVSTAGTFTVTVTNAGGCSGSTSATTNVTALPVAAITPSGTVTTCNTSQLLSATTGIGYDYQWRLNGSNINGATSATYNATSSGNYDVVVSANGCSATSPQTILTLGTGSPVITANGSTTICAASSVMLSAPAGASAYQWYRNNVALTSATGQNFTATSHGTYYCYVTGSCSGNSNAIVITVINNPTPVISSVTPRTFCSPGYVVLNANTFTGVTYQWQKNSVDIPGATSASLTVTDAGGYRVIETANGCSKSITASVLNASSVSAHISTNDQTTICAMNGTVTMNVDDTIPGYSYQWQKDGIAISGATATSYTATSSGNYTCQISASCGTTVSNNIAVSIGTFAASITPMGTVYICSGASIVLSASTGTNFTYQWKLNGVDIPGENGPTLTINTAGNYSVYMTSPCGNALSNTVVVNSATVVASITPAGTSTICAAQFIQLSTPSDPSYTYQWYRNNVPLTNGSVPTYNTGTHGTYKVVVSLNGVCPVTSNDAVVSVINNPTPVITASGPLTFCDGDSVTLNTNNWSGATYQWTKNSVDIAGATALSYTATTKGSYRVRQTGNGCSKLSPSRSVNVNSCRLAADGITELSEEAYITISPNPVLNRSEISVEGDMVLSNAQLEVVDLLGNKVVSLKKINNNHLSFEKGNLRAGVYMLHIVNGDGITVSKRFVVQ